LVTESRDCSAATVEELYGEMDLDGSGHVDLLDWLKFFEPGRKIHKMFKAMKDTHSVLYLSEDGQIQMANMLLRARTIAESASTLGVRMMVDAEQSYYQPGIRHIAVSVLMPDYNHTIPVVYNTIQSYLKKSPAVIEEDVALSKRWQFYYGVKLVRGAYMEQERERAEEMGYSSPIHDTKEDTDSCYNGNITRLLREAKGGRVSLMVASHNEESASHAVREMSRLGVPAHDGTVTFGQLYGMCDHVSLTLGQSGYEVYKYLPYGPINEVMPYLIRRANENRAMMKGADKYRKLISRELRRRAKSSFTRREKLARSDTT
jgi:proline dehydrogenase